GDNACAAGQGRLFDAADFLSRPHIRHRPGRATVPDDQGGRRHGPDRRTTAGHRRAALDRGAEASRADQVAMGLTTRVRTTTEMTTALAYILDASDGRTDVLLFSME